MNHVQENYIKEDEIDLRELFGTILKGKKIIAMITVVVVASSLIYVLKLPNVYESQTLIIPITTKKGGLDGLSGLAAIAGISIGGEGGSLKPDIAFNSLLSNYDFMKKFVVKNKIVDFYDSDDFDKNYVFAFGFRGIYDTLKSKPDSDMDEESKIFQIVKKIQSKFSIIRDKKTSLIAVSYSDSDRNYPPLMIKAFLKDASEYLVKNNLRTINNKLGYFKKELMATQGFELRQRISGIVLKILEEKVLMNSKTYYQCDILTSPMPSYIKDKIKPKRTLILVVSFITSIILGIFLVLFLEFIKKEELTE